MNYNRFAVDGVTPTGHPALITRTSYNDNVRSLCTMYIIAILVALNYFISSTCRCCRPYAIFIKAPHVHSTV